MSEILQGQKQILGDIIEARPCIVRRPGPDMGNFVELPPETLVTIISIKKMSRRRTALWLTDADDNIWRVTISSS